MWPFLLSGTPGCNTYILTLWAAQPAPKVLLHEAWFQQGKPVAAGRWCLCPRQSLCGLSIFVFVGLCLSMASFLRQQPQVSHTKPCAQPARGSVHDNDQQIHRRFKRKGTLHMCFLKYDRQLSNPHQASFEMEFAILHMAVIQDALFPQVGHNPHSKPADTKNGHCATPRETEVYQQP